MATAETTRRRVPAAALAIAVAVLVAACGADGPERNAGGVIDKAGESGLLELRQGDCVRNLRESNADPDRGHNGVLQVDAVPCSQLHDAEVLRVSALADGSFPGFSIVDGEAARGRSALQPRLSRVNGGRGLALFTFKPSDERWEFEDQREIVYLVLYQRPRRGMFEQIAPAPSGRPRDHPG